jgi:hypothetical protein
VWSAIKRVGSIEIGGLPKGDLSRGKAGLVLTALVAVSTIAYGLTTGHVKNIWILPDELTYGLLARSFGTTGHFAIRGVDTLAYPVGYPFLIAAAFVHRAPVAAYDMAKWINSLLMSLAAVPTYLIARRLLPRWHSLLAAALTLLIPSMAYTGVLMSENAFFPLVVLSFLAFVRAMERPAVDRQLLALIVIVPAIAVRAEGLVLIPVLLCSMVLLAICCADRRAGNYLRSLVRELWLFKATWIILPLVVAILVVGEAAVGKSPGAVLGRYSTTLSTYPFWRTLHWAVYQVVDLEFYLAVLPFIPATIVAVALLRRAHVPRPERAVASTAICSAVLFVIVAAATSQGRQGGSNHNYVPLPPDVHDRYCFFVAPLFLTLFVLWVHRRREFSNRVLIPLLVAAAVLPLFLPYADVHSLADFDALALLPWHNKLIADRNVPYAMAVTAGLLALLLIPRRRVITVVQVVTVGLLLWFVGAVARSDMASASQDIPTSHPHERSWIDTAVPPGTKVAILWKPVSGWSLRKIVRREQALWRAEFLNSSVNRVFYVSRPMHYDLPSTAVATPIRRLTPSASRSDPYEYVLVGSPVQVSGQVVARDRAASLTLYKLRSRASH